MILGSDLVYNGKDLVENLGFYMKQIRVDLGLKVEGFDGVFWDLFPFFFDVSKIEKYRND